MLSDYELDVALRDGLQLRLNNIDREIEEQHRDLAQINSKIRMLQRQKQIVRHNINKIDSK